MSTPKELGYQKPNPTGSIRNVYDAAATENSQNYDDIMGNYDNLLGNIKNNRGGKLNYVPINPIFTKNIQGQQYSRSNDLNNAITGLDEYSKTGGYSDADIGNIRERGISPIRSIYANAQQNLNRQKSLSGGYSPNQGALTAKMARESSSQIGDLSTRINADIAQMIASGKLSALNSLGSITGRENEQINSVNQRNVDLQRDVDLHNTNEQRRVDDLNNQYKLKIEDFNKGSEQQNFNNELGAIEGKRSLYGTTPALTQTFANQVLQNNQQNMQAATTANMIKNQRANIGLNLVQSQLGGSPVRR